jgi:hypothetical protein
MFPQRDDQVIEGNGQSEKTDTRNGWDGLPLMTLSFISSLCMDCFVIGVGGAVLQQGIGNLGGRGSHTFHGHR